MAVLSRTLPSNRDPARLIPKLPAGQSLLHSYDSTVEILYKIVQIPLSTEHHLHQELSYRFKADHLP